MSTRPYRPADARKLTAAELLEWARVKHQPLSREDWVDLFNTIEDYKRRRIARDLQAKADQ